MPRIRASKKGEGVQAVVLALRVLEYVAGQTEPVGITVLAQALGTTKSRIHRHLRTLMHGGYITQSVKTEKYHAGVRLITLGRTVSENFDLTSIARRPMRELRDLLGHSVVISLVETDGVRVFATLPGKSFFDIGVKQGSLLGFHYSAQGKIAVAFGEEDLRARVFRSRLEMQTPKTIVNAARLRHEINLIQRQGWAAAPNETVLGLNALAAPIFDASGTLLGAIAIVDSIQFLQDEPSEEQIRHTVGAARAISDALGYVAGKPKAPRAAAASDARIPAALAE